MKKKENDMEGMCPVSERTLMKSYGRCGEREREESCNVVIPLIVLLFLSCVFIAISQSSS